MDSQWKTRESLLIRAKKSDNDDAWDEFIDFYKPFIHIVLRYIKIPEDAIDDTTQEVLLKMWKFLKNFEPDNDKANFRTWLSKVIRNAAYDFFTKQNKHTDRLDSYKESSTFEFPDKENSDLEDQIKKEWENYITQAALANVKKLFSGVAIDVFQQSLRGKSTKEIGEACGITQASARTLRNRVRVRLIEEIKFLRESQEF